MARTGTCRECGEQFEWPKAMGMVPRICPRCRRRLNAARQREWRMANPERSKQIYDKANAKRQADPEFRQRRRDDGIRQRYGISPEEYDKLVRKQRGVCAICKGGPNGPGSRLHVDHCHESRRVRGLLCSRCNTLIGLAHEDPVVLRTALRYLKR